MQVILWSVRKWYSEVLFCLFNSRSPFLLIGIGTKILSVYKPSRYLLFKVEPSVKRRDAIIGCEDSNSNLLDAVSFYPSVCQVCFVYVIN